MGDGALGSDHVNYLVLRYLQENGHESAAKALYKDWHRPEQFNDPENLPFASAVRQHELIRIIQDGLYLDQLQAGVTNGSRRFSLIDPTSSRPSSAQRPQPKPASRRPSAYAAPDHNDFPTPAPKRIRRSNGSEPHVNGDAMEIDNKPQEDEESVADQDNAQSEPEVPTEEEPEPVEMTTATTQTDKESKVRTKTLYWTLDKREPTSIFHTSWNPQAAMNTRLLAVGESLCRLYDIPPPEVEGEDIIHLNPIDVSGSSVISAACWHPSGRFYTCAMDKPNNNGRQDSHTMFDCSVDGMKRFYELQLHLLRPPGMALAIRYTTSGTHMLTVSTNGRRGLLEIWPASGAAKYREPIAAKLFGDIILDAVWISETSIAVVGNNMLEVLSIIHVPDRTNGITNGNATVSDGARNLRTDFSHPTEAQWDKVRFDATHDVLVASSASDKTLTFLRRSGDKWLVEHGPENQDGTDHGVTALAFQPHPKETTTPPKPRRLAVAHDSGDVRVFEVTASSHNLISHLTLGPREPALAVAWASARGLLAVASDEAIKIWDLDTDRTAPVVSWQAAPAKWYQGNEHNLPGDEDGQAEPSLSWDAGDRRLAFAVGRKIAVVSLLDNPSRADAEEVNGGEAKEAE